MAGEDRRPGPLLVTAELPPDILAWADRLRRAHYPPDRNRIAAHVTLFHGLPPSAETEIRAMLARIAAAYPSPHARISGIMPLGGGTAVKVHSPEMVAIHDELATTFHGLLTQQDSHPLVLHITVQNKVSREEARQLQEALRQALESREFTFPGLALHVYRDGLWDFVQAWRFRGAKGG